MTEERGERHAVTSAYGFTGRYIARALLRQGRKVRTLTRRASGASEFDGTIDRAPLDFSNPAQLATSLEGAAVLYNTYWVRFCFGRETFENAVRNSEVLIRAAQSAGVKRIVHISVTNPSVHSALAYFRGKAMVEEIIAQSGLSFAILRPALIFGREDILLNNIAWTLRRFRVFAIPGDGNYRVQPVFVEDLAEMAVQAADTEGNQIIDTVGTEIFAFEELVRRIAERIGRRVRFVHVSPGQAYWLVRLLGLAVRDVVLTREEIKGLMAGLLVSQSLPTAPTRFTDWLDAHAASLGKKYSSEVARHFRVAAAEGQR